MRNFDSINDAVLVHMWHVAFTMLAQAQFDLGNTRRLKRCEFRLYSIVQELDKRGL